MSPVKSYRLSSSLILTVLMLSNGAIASANNLPKDGTFIAQDKKTGKVNFIGSNSPEGIKLPPGVPTFASNPQANARSFLRAYGNAFGIGNPDRDLSERKSFKLDGLPTVKYQQRYNNVPILGAEINVNLDVKGNLLSMGGESATISRLFSTTSTVSSASATRTALGVVAKRYKLNPSQLKASKPELTIYQPGIIDEGSGTARLVWLVKVKPKKVQPIDQIVLVDARKPDKIVLTWNNNPHGRNRLTYTASGTGNLPGTLVCTETTLGSDCAPSGTSDSAKAHTYAADTHDFYRIYHGRDSLDGYGLPIISTVNFDDGGTCPNAFWNSTQMVYCAGLAVDDVVGHELTHGVTEYTSGLLYYYQSGAINESLSDVWGEFVDLTNGKGNDVAAVRWQLGEDIPTSLFGGPIRDMRNPTAYNNPDKMTSPYYYTGSEDNGGVHTNSGVNNKAVTLMVDGGTFNGRTVTGIGIAKVAKIYYRVQTTMLTSGSSYKDLYNYVNMSCKALVGTPIGINNADCTQVNNALLAVEMNLEPYAGFQPQASYCPAGKTISNSYFDNLEGSNRWHFLNLVSYNPWRIDTNYATSGTNSLAVDDVSSQTDSVAVMKTGTVIPAASFLYFRHAYGLEEGYDGGVLEYSIGSSGVWQDAGSLFIQGKNYDATLGTSSNPLGGRNAFTGDSHGYVSSKYNLASLAGQTVRFRFRQANDFSVGGAGWNVDDFRIFRCL